MVSGVHKPPEGRGKILLCNLGGGVVLPRLGVSRFTILSLFFVMLFSISKLFEQYSQTNLPVIKTTPFKVTEHKKYGRYLGQSGRRYKSL